jgi:hypothetical protein
MGFEIAEFVYRFGSSGNDGEDVMPIRMMLMERTGKPPRTMDSSGVGRGDLTAEVMDRLLRGHRIKKFEYRVDDHENAEVFFTLDDGNTLRIDTPGPNHTCRLFYYKTLPER